MSDAETTNAFSPQPGPSEGRAKYPLRNDSDSSSDSETSCSSGSHSGGYSDGDTTFRGGRKPSTSTGITVITEDGYNDDVFARKAVLTGDELCPSSAHPEASASSDLNCEHSVPDTSRADEKNSVERPLVDAHKDRTDLVQHQRKWLLYRPFIESCGYDLPYRYRAGYVPHANDLNANAEDDILSITHPSLINATRRTDGVKVVLKHVENIRQIGYVQQLNDVRRVNDPDNHCIRLYDVLHLPGEKGPRAMDGDAVFLVTPLLRVWNETPLQTVGEAVAMFAQLAECLRYMHRHNTAYNATLTQSTLYGPAHIPWRTGPKYGRSRMLDPPKYYLCDFSKAQSFHELPPKVAVDDSRLPCDEGTRGLEMRNVKSIVTRPFPFANDVFNLGQFFNTEFLRCYDGFDWLQPLINDMVHPDPSARPDMDTVITRFAVARRNILWHKHRSRLILKHSPYSFPRLAHKLRHMAKSVGWLACGAPAVPRAYCERELNLLEDIRHRRSDAKEDGSGGSTS